MWNVLSGFLVFWLSSVSFIIISILILFAVSLTYDVSSWAWEGENDVLPIVGSSDGNTRSTSKKGAKWKKCSKKSSRNRKNTGDVSKRGPQKLHTRTPSAPVSLSRTHSKTDPYNVINTSDPSSSKGLTISYSDTDISDTSLLQLNTGTDTSNLPASAITNNSTSLDGAYTRAGTSKCSTSSASTTPYTIKVNSNGNKGNEMSASENRYVNEVQPTKTTHRNRSASAERRGNNTTEVESAVSSTDIDSGVETTTIAVPGNAAVVVVYGGAQERSASPRPMSPYKSASTDISLRAARDNVVQTHSAENITVRVSRRVASPCPLEEEAADQTVEKPARAVPNTPETPPMKSSPSVATQESADSSTSETHPTKPSTPLSTPVCVLSNTPDILKMKSFVLVDTPVGTQNDPCSTPVSKLADTVPPDAPTVTSNTDTPTADSIPTDSEKQNSKEHSTKTSTRSIKLKASFKQFYPKSFLERLLGATSNVDKTTDSMASDPELVTSCTSSNSVNVPENNAVAEARNTCTVVSDKSAGTPKATIFSPMTLNALFPFSLNSLVERGTLHSNVKVPDAIIPHDAVNAQGRRLSLSIHNVPIPPATSGSSLTTRYEPTSASKTSHVIAPKQRKDLQVHSERERNVNMSGLSQIPSLDPTIDLALTLNNMMGPNVPGIWDSLVEASTTPVAGTTSEIMRVSVTAIRNRRNTSEAPENVNGRTTTAGGFVGYNGSPPVVTVDAVGDLGVEVATAKSSQEVFASTQDATGDSVPP